MKMELGGTNLKLSNPDKLMFPNEGIIKSDLASYYERISEVMLPHVQDRPVTMHRFPDGIESDGFYEKKRPSHFPGWIPTISIELAADGQQYQFSIQDARTLVYLADQACITPHVWLSRKDDLHHPDKILFDLDPPGSDFSPVRESALLLKGFFDERGVTSFPMTTGSRGMHIVVPLSKGHDFDEVRGMARTIGSILVKEHPDRLTMEMRKEKREGRLFLDYTRNSYGQTSVAPYAVRALLGAPVATPIEWKELNASMHSQRYCIANMFRRLGQKDDPWKDIACHKVSLKKMK